MCISPTDLAELNLVNSGWREDSVAVHARSVGLARRLRFERVCERPGTIEIAPAALRKLLSFQQNDRGDPEAGGVLLGRLIEESDDVVIDEVGVPSGEDRRGRTFFRRARRAAQRLVDRAWRKSRGARVYLGEWHTHPEAVPHPSTQDTSDWLRIARDARFEHDFLLFMIIGTEATRMWLLKRGESEALELKQHPGATSAPEPVIPEL